MTGVAGTTTGTGAVLTVTRNAVDAVDAVETVANELVVSVATVELVGRQPAFAGPPQVDSDSEPEVTPEPNCDAADDDNDELCDEIDDWADP